jgi:hypothetical protein
MARNSAKAAQLRVSHAPTFKVAPKLVESAVAASGKVSFEER